MKLYMAVEDDEYELPVFIEESRMALARKLGVSKTTVFRYYNGKTKESKTGYRFIEVEIDEED